MREQAQRLLDTTGSVRAKCTNVSAPLPPSPPVTTYVCVLGAGGGCCLQTGVAMMHMCGRLAGSTRAGLHWQTKSQQLTRPERGRLSPCVSRFSRLSASVTAVLFPGLHASGRKIRLSPQQPQAVPIIRSRDHGGGGHTYVHVSANDGAHGWSRFDMDPLSVYGVSVYAMFKSQTSAVFSTWV